MNLIDKPNIKQFLKQSSQSEGLFIYDKRGYRYAKGHLCGVYIVDVIVDYKYETKEFLEELYDETEFYHTRMVIKDILKLYF